MSETPFSAIGKEANPINGIKNNVVKIINLTK